MPRTDLTEWPPSTCGTSNDPAVNMVDSKQVRLTLLYDDECPLCCRFKQAVESWDSDGVIELVALSSAAAQSRFRHVDLDQAREQLTVCDRLGNTSHGIEALRRLTRLLPGIRRLSWAYRLPGVTPAIGKIYRAANRRRKQLCLKCGQRWMPSLKYRRNKGR